MPNKKKNNASKSNKVKARKVVASQAKNATFAGSGVIDAPVALDMSRPIVSQRFMKPSHKGSEGRVTGVDFVGTVDSVAATYLITTYNINARNVTLFPRLSAIASVWRRYYPRKLKFHLFGINAATQRGYVAMSSLVTDDLATLTTPTTEAQILNQENIAVGRPWSYTCHTVNLGGLGLLWYSSDSTQSNTEFGEFIGRAFLGIPGTSANADISVQVYVEYDFEFCQRITASLVPAPFDRIGGRVFQTNLTPSASNLLVGGTLDNSTQNIILDDTAGTVTLTLGGTYLIDVFISGTTLVGPAALSGGGLIASVTNAGSSALSASFLINDAPEGTILGPLSISSYASLTNIQFRIANAPSASLSETRLHQFPQLRMMEDHPSWRKSSPSRYPIGKQCSNEQ